MSNQVTSKGQVTIPKKIRDYLGIKPGAAVEFEPGADGRVAIIAAAAKKRQRSPSRFSKLRGTATVKMTTRQIMALTRGRD
ncbi:MAG TPA: AbrB/MazE/SpoVT family DNA-binding domain-containing protein [Burkholderiales bacterium]|jgi:AbrB family looped-hinge helix DNA binding protein|nr:AbrB/MazE/SpoVT family DNA-binding domain-containing protein [Burkholderiales bacterium]